MSSTVCHMETTLSNTCVSTNAKFISTNVHVSLVYNYVQSIYNTL